MANASTTGFGFRPIKKVGQNYNNAGLSEYNIAASSALISHAAMVQLTADGVILSSGNTDTNNLGVLNGVFFTDALPSVCKRNITVVYFEIKNFGYNSEYTGSIVHHGCF
jgi:hypothetical protein